MLTIDSQNSFKDVTKRHGASYVFNHNTMNLISQLVFKYGKQKGVNEKIANELGILPKEVSFYLSKLTDSDI